MPRSAQADLSLSWVHMSICWFYHAADHISSCVKRKPKYHTGPSFNTGTENTIQVSKFKRIGFDKMADLDGGKSVSAYSVINLH